MKNSYTFQKHISNESNDMKTLYYSHTNRGKSSCIGWRQRERVVSCTAREVMSEPRR